MPFKGLMRNPASSRSGGSSRRSSTRSASRRRRRAGSSCGCRRPCEDADYLDRARAEFDRDLLRRYHEHGDVGAREELVQRHLPLVRSLARRFAGRGESLEDLEQVGAIGLIKAIDRFEMSREVALTSYATPNVVGEIKRHFRDRGSAIRIPRNLKELSAKLGKAMERLTALHGRSPTIAELATELNTTPEQVLEALEACSARSTVSLSARSEEH